VTRSKLNSLWRLFAATRDEGAREKIIVAHAQKVRRIAWGLKKRLPAHVDVEDLMSAGYVGLVEAVDRFDPTLGSFGTYCEEKVRGAILDYLRSDDWVPRRVRKNAHRLESARAELARELGRDATDEEVAAHLGVSATRFLGLLDDADTKVLLSLEAARPEDETTRFIDFLEDRTTVDPLEKLSEGDAWKHALRGLLPKERAVLIGLFEDRKTESAIATEIGVSESRVSQIKLQALEFLRRRFG
jgi:RNA polymerase sigma factor for flagellar operon FliA